MGKRKLKDEKKTRSNSDKKNITSLQEKTSKPKSGSSICLEENKKTKKRNKKYKEKAQSFTSGEEYRSARFTQLSEQRYVCIF